MDERETQGRKTDAAPAGDEALLRFLQQEGRTGENDADAEKMPAGAQTPAAGAPAGRAQDFSDNTFASFGESAVFGGASAPSGEGNVPGGTGGRAENAKGAEGAEGARGFSEGTFVSFEPEGGNGPVRTPLPPQKERSVLGTVSLVLGIIGIVCCCMMPPVGIAAIICAAIARSRDGSFSGVSMAGLILGIIVTVLGTVAIVSGIFSFIMFLEEGLPLPPDSGWEENIQEQIRALRFLVRR